MRPEMITQIFQIQKQFSCVTHVSNWKLLPRQFMCVIGAFKEIPSLTPELHKKYPGRKPCVTDVLCNREIHSQIKNMRVVCNHFGPHMQAAKKDPRTSTVSSNAPFAPSAMHLTSQQSPPLLPHCTGHVWETNAFYQCWWWCIGVQHR